MTLELRDRTAMRVKRPPPPPNTCVYIAERKPWQPFIQTKVLLSALCRSVNLSWQSFIQILFRWKSGALWWNFRIITNLNLTTKRARVSKMLFQKPAQKMLYIIAIIYSRPVTSSLFIMFVVSHGGRIHLFKCRNARCSNVNGSYIRVTPWHTNVTFENHHVW